MSIAARIFAQQRGTNALRTAIEQRRVAEDFVAEVLKVLYPPGADIHWEIAGRRQRGTVVMNCFGDRLKVHNARTGRDRFIYAYDIVC